MDLEAIEEWMSSRYVQRGARPNTPMELALRHIVALIAEVRRLREES